MRVDMLIQLIKIYEQYANDVRKRRQKSSVFAGLFGLGDDPRKDHLHDEFYETVQKWTQSFLQGKPNKTNVTKAVKWIIEAAALHRDEETYWYYYAAQAHAKPMIPLLDAEDRKTIRDLYQKHYPPIDRMPVQREIFHLLCECESDK